MSVRDEDGVRRAAKRLSAAAFCVLADGGSEAEARAAFDAGVAEYWQMRAKLDVSPPDRAPAPLDVEPGSAAERFLKDTGVI